MSKDSEEFITLFTKFDIFKYLVMLFGLQNRPVFWHYFINNILFDYSYLFI